MEHSNFHHKLFESDLNLEGIKISIDADVESVQTASVAFAHPTPTRSKMVNI